MKYCFILLFSTIVLSGCSNEPDLDSFRIVIIEKPDGTNWNAVRYNRYTGESWFAISGAWKKIVDEEAIMESSYDVKLVPVNNGWAAIRIDINSGASWRANIGKWVKMLAINSEK